MTEILASFFRITSWPFDSFVDGRCESMSSSVRPPNSESSRLGGEAFVGRDLRGVAALPFPLTWEIPLVFQSFTRPEGLVLPVRHFCCGLLIHSRELRWLVSGCYCLSVLTHALLLSSAGCFSRSCLNRVFSASTASLVSPLAAFFFFYIIFIS
jgi:hypothetical protein